MEHDPIEDNPQYRSIFATIDDEAEASLAEKGHTLKTVGMGYCHMFWGAKQQILLEKYGIEWKSPDEMNPEVLSD